MGQKQKLLVYRATEISEKEVQFFESNKGLAIELLGFISTSLQIQSAKGFGGNSIFVIHIDETKDRDE